MTATFLVTLDLDSVDPQTLTSVASDIDEACESSGLPVVEVKPWERPTMQPTPTIL